MNSPNFKRLEKEPEVLKSEEKEPEVLKSEEKEKGDSISY